MILSSWFPGHEARVWKRAFRVVSEFRKHQLEICYCKKDGPYSQVIIQAHQRLAAGLFENENRKPDVPLPVGASYAQVARAYDTDRDHRFVMMDLRHPLPSIYKENTSERSHRN